jgi:hypothetical protein
MSKSTFVKIRLYCPASIVIALTLLLSAATCLGQVDQGAITGQVQDPSGAVVPNALVTVTNVDTGLALQIRTNATGTYMLCHRSRLVITR